MPHSYAQTNIQLYNQMRDMGYVLGDIEQTKDAYEFSLRLFTGQYRPNGKPFINHLVGTASILVAERVEAQLVIAALLHAAYSHGHFSFHLLNLHTLQRRKLRQMLGKEQESLIYAYTNLKWNEGNVRDINRRVSKLNEAERDIIIIRLANEIEDHLDIGLSYGGKVKSMYERNDILQVLQELATALGFADLARNIRINVAEQHNSAIPKSLARQEATSFYMPPRMSAWMKYRLKSLVNKHASR